MTLLRNDLRTEEVGDRGGWLEGLLTRRPKTQAESTRDRADRPGGERMEAATGEDQAPSPHIPVSGKVGGSARPEPVAAAEAAPPAAVPIKATPPIRPRGQAGVRPAMIGGMAAVALVGFSAIALLRGEVAWAPVPLLMTLALFGVSAVAILNRQGARRAAWQGFAIFGCGYLALASASSLPVRAGLELPTSILVRHAHALATAFVPFAGGVDQFLVVGHCWFALIAGLIGSVIARWFERTNLASP